MRGKAHSINRSPARPTQREGLSGQIILHSARIILDRAEDLVMIDAEQRLPNTVVLYEHLGDVSEVLWIKASENSEQIRIWPSLSSLMSTSMSWLQKIPQEDSPVRMKVNEERRKSKAVLLLLPPAAEVGAESSDLKAPSKHTCSIKVYLVSLFPVSNPEEISNYTYISQHFRLELETCRKKRKR